ncbi:MAG: hypothetical protein ACT4NL_14225 [Pseudomarimonas sp.]
MSNLSLQPSALIVMGLAAASATNVQAGDWRCDRPAHYYPPVGCALAGAYLTEGLCTSYPATTNWHCLSSWRASPIGGGNHSNAVKTLDSLSLPLPPDFALLDPTDTGRSMRLALDTRALEVGVGRSWPVLELQSMDAKRHGISLSIERDGHAGFELVVRQIGEQRPLTRLSLDKGSSSVLVDWRNDEINGPQLTLASGLQGVEVGMPRLDAQSRLLLWQNPGVELHFDVSTRQTESAEAGVDSDSDSDSERKTR